MPSVLMELLRGKCVRRVFTLVMGDPGVVSTFKLGNVRPGLVFCSSLRDYTKLLLCGEVPEFIRDISVLNKPRFCQCDQL